MSGCEYLLQIDRGVLPVFCYLAAKAGNREIEGEREGEKKKESRFLYEEYRHIHIKETNALKARTFLK